MRSRRQGVLTALAAAVLVVAFGGAGPASASATTTPQVSLVLSAATCNPAGTPGIRGTVAATVTGTTMKFGQLVAFEFQPISDPAFAPFTWTGGSVATWIDEGGYKTGVASETRTIDTTNPAMWDRGNYSKDIWFGSKTDSWWHLNYSVSMTSRMTSYQVTHGWYVSCPTGTIIDAATLRTIEQAPMPRT